MPTLNWVLEAAEDRYVDAMHNRSTAASDTASAPLTFQLSCPFCARIFSGCDAHAVAREVARHIPADHPLKRPVIVVDGMVLPRNSTIAHLPDLDDVAIENTTGIHATVDGEDVGALSIEELRALLTDHPKRMLNVRMVNARSEDGLAAPVEYAIKVDVADPAELNAVDAAFLRHLARADPTRDDVMRFSDETDGQANYYRDGLVSYVLGVLAKDEHDGWDPHVLERALDNLARSAHHLASFLDRSVGSAVAACARFNLNEMNPFDDATGISEIDVVSRFLLALSQGEEELAWPTRPPIVASDLRCPVDEATFALLECTFRIDEDRPNAVLAEQLDRLEHAGLTSPDRAKLAVVVGDWASRHGLPDVVSRCANTLYNDTVFEAVVRRWGTA